jgi:hypothetical protein
LRRPSPWIRYDFLFRQSLMRRACASFCEDRGVYLVHDGMMSRLLIGFWCGFSCVGRETWSKCLLIHSLVCSHGMMILRHC